MKIFQTFLPFQKFEIQTKLSKREILHRVDDFADPKYTDYYCHITDNGFVIAEKCLKSLTFGHSKNSFAPVATAEITEKDGISSVKGILRMRIFCLFIFIPIYLISLITLVPFPFTYLLMYFAFIRPANKLKKELEFLLSEREMD